MNRFLNQNFFRQLVIFFVIVLTGFSLAAFFIPQMNTESEVQAVNPIGN